MGLASGLVSVLCSSLEPGLDPTCGASDAGLDGLFAFTGQSNQIQADYNATAHSDGGYGHGVPFANAIMSAMYNSSGPAGSPAGPQTFTIIPTQLLKAAAAAGLANQGPWLQFAKYLIARGYKRVGIILCCISGSSERRHRGVNSGFPSVGPTVFAQWVTYILARQAEYGRKVDAVVRVDGETDAGSDPLDAPTYQQNITDDIAAWRTQLGNANLYHIICQLNAATSFGPNQAVIRAAQAAYVVSDPLSRLVNFDRFPLAFDPHYASAEQNDMGDEVGATLVDIFKPGLLPETVVGPAPKYVHASCGITSLAAPATMNPRSGPRPKSGNWEFLAVRTYSAATTIVLTDAQGFVLIASVTSSISAGTIANNLAVYGRQVDPAAYVNGRMPVPTVSGGTATRCVSRVFECSGPAAWSASPVSANSTGANNANSTALSIASATSTANNQLALLFMATAAQNNFISTITNPNLVGITKHWDSSYNPGDAFIGLAFASATVPVSGTVLGATTIATSLAGVNAGILLLVTP
jgi:hypothetical protein